MQCIWFINKISSVIDQSTRTAATKNKFNVGIKLTNWMTQDFLKSI